MHMLAHSCRLQSSTRRCSHFCWTDSLNTACSSRGKQKICQAKLICRLDKLNSISERLLHRMYRCLQTWKESAFLSQAMGAKFRCESEFSNSAGSLRWCILHLLPPPLIPGVHYAGLASLRFSFHLCSLRCTQAHIHQPQFKSLRFLHESWALPSKAVFKEFKEVLG